MSRISLVEAYDNRDVIGQLVKLRQDVQQLYDIVENIDPSGDLTNFVTKTGDETIDGIKTFVGKIVADCDIIQLGNGYETHAEQVYSKDDYIVMRDGAIAGLAAGDRSGLQVKLYNGVDDARLAVDRDGVARVGDVGDEQPLMTRDETADMTSGNILSWDGVNQKAITSGTNVAAITGDISTLQTDVAAKVSGTGNIGSDSKPVKIVNGAAVAVTNDLGIVNSTNFYSESTSASTGSSSIMTKSVSEAGTYLCIATVEVANAPIGIAILGISNQANVGWGIKANNTSVDYVRMNMSVVMTFNAGASVYVNFYNGFGTTVSPNCRLTLTKLS